MTDQRRKFSLNPGKNPKFSGQCASGAMSLLLFQQCNAGAAHRCREWRPGLLCCAKNQRPVTVCCSNGEKSGVAIKKVEGDSTLKKRPVLSRAPPRSFSVKEEELVPGKVLTGRVKAIMTFGAFIDLDARFDGLLHISKIADRFVQNVEDFLTVGQEIQVELESVDLSKRRIQLKRHGPKAPENGSPGASKVSSFGTAQVERNGAPGGSKASTSGTMQVERNGAPGASKASSAGTTQVERNGSPGVSKVSSSGTTQVERNGAPGASKASSAGTSQVERNGAPEASKASSAGTSQVERDGGPKATSAGTTQVERTGAPAAPKDSSTGTQAAKDRASTNGTPAAAASRDATIPSRITGTSRPSSQVPGAKIQPGSGSSTTQREISQAPSSGKFAGRNPPPRTSYQKGQVVSGVVKNYTRRGCFVQLPGNQEGFLHANEIAASRQREPVPIENLVKVGQELKAKVLRIIDGRINLTMKEEVDLEKINEELNENVVATNPFELAFRKNPVIRSYLKETGRLEDPTRDGNEDDGTKEVKDSSKESSSREQLDQR